jgi:hypothetical protein
VVIDDATSESAVLAILRDAHKRCLIANSITAVVEINPTIAVQEVTSAEAAGEN